MSNKWELFEIEDHEKINDLLDKRFNELIRACSVIITI